MNDLSIYTAVARKSRCLPRANINSLASAVMNPTQLRELVSNYRASNVLKELRDHGMVELCNFNDHSIPVSLAAMIEDQCKLSASLEMIRCQEMRQVFSVLDDARIESLLVLGGTALAYSIYKAPWRRPRSGTNILVEKNSLPAIIAVLLEIGYQQAEHVTSSGPATLYREINDNTYHMLNLYWQNGDRHSLADSHDLAELLDRASPLKKISRHALAPSAQHSLLIAALYFAGNHRHAERLIKYYDIHLLLPQLSPTDWETLPGISAGKGIAETTCRLVGRTAELFGSAVPAGFLEDWTDQISDGRLETKNG